MPPSRAAITRGVAHVGGHQVYVLDAGHVVAGSQLQRSGWNPVLIRAQGNRLWVKPRDARDGDEWEPVAPEDTATFRNVRAMPKGYTLPGSLHVAPGDLITTYKFCVVVPSFIATPLAPRATAWLMGTGQRLPLRVDQMLSGSQLEVGAVIPDARWNWTFTRDSDCPPNSAYEISVVYSLAPSPRASPAAPAVDAARSPVPPLSPCCL